MPWRWVCCSQKCWEIKKSLLRCVTKKSTQRTPMRTIQKHMANYDFTMYPIKNAHGELLEHGKIRFAGSVFLWRVCFSSDWLIEDTWGTSRHSTSSWFLVVSIGHFIYPSIILISLMKQVTSCHSFEALVSSTNPWHWNQIIRSFIQKLMYLLFVCYIQCYQLFW